MEAILFLLVWLGGAILHTLVELSAKNCCGTGFFGQAAEEDKCVKCRNENWMRDNRL